MNNDKKSTLLILDNETNFEFLSGTASPEYTVHTAKSGSSALEMAEKFLPSVILLNTTVPDMNSSDVLKALKASEITRHIPVIVIKADNAEAGEKSQDLGAADCIYKPFSAQFSTSQPKHQIHRTIEHDIQQPAPAKDEFLPLKLPYARVLVVDDVEINLEVAMAMMHSYEMQIDGVTSGQQAIDAIRDEKQKYHAIFMDHFMPDLDGMETVKIIRQEIGTEYARTIPIIALTAESDAETEEMFLSNGFQAFLPKPVEIAHLDAVLRKWVRDGELEKASAGKQNTAGGKTCPSTSSEYSGVEQRSGKDRRKGYDRRAFRNKIEGLDIQKGLSRFGGDMEDYLQVLRSFNANIPILIEAIRKVGRNNLKEYAITVHGIRGSCWGIWAETAGELATHLERAAKAGDFDFVAANNPFLIATLSKLITDIEAAIHREASLQSKPEKNMPDRDILSKILTACKSYNMTQANALIKELEQFEYASHGELVLWLRENADQMNCLEIVERLSDWLKEP